jgi:hypothetical protein
MPGLPIANPVLGEIDIERSHVYRVLSDVNDELEEVMDGNCSSSDFLSCGLVHDIHRMLVDILSHMQRQFALEAEEFFPSLVSERPELLAALESLQREHVTLLASLTSIIELIDFGYTDRSTWLTVDSVFQSFAWSLSSHHSRKRLAIGDTETNSSGAPIPTNKRCVNARELRQ